MGQILSLLFYLFEMFHLSVDSSKPKASPWEKGALRRGPPNHSECFKDPQSFKSTCTVTL